MVNNNSLKMKLYDQTASLIAELFYKGFIEEQEMMFLLNILEIVINNRNKEIIDLLNSWLDSKVDKDTNNHIKKMLLEIDFNNINEEKIQEILLMLSSSK